MPTYIDSPTDVDFITSIPNEGASTVKRELRKSLYNHVDAPQKKPSHLSASELAEEQQARIEQGVAANEAEAFEQIAVPDEQAISDELDRYYSLLTTNSPVPGAEQTLLALPAAFARKELDTSAPLWYGTFEVAKRDDGSEWTAICVSTLDPVENYEAANRHTDIEDDDVWLPTYALEDVWHVYDHPPEVALHLTRPSSDELACTRAHPDDADIYLHSPTPTEYDSIQFALDSPKDAKEDIKTIPSPPAYPEYDHDRYQWLINGEGLLVTIDTLTTAGWTVAISPTIESRYLSLYESDSSVPSGDLPPLPDC